jgi:Glycosyl transferases group 1
MAGLRRRPESERLCLFVTPSSPQISISPNASVNTNPDCELLSYRTTLIPPSRNCLKDTTAQSKTPTGRETRESMLATSAICRLLARDSRIVLRVVGFFNPGPELRRYRDRIEFYPLQDFLNLQRLIAEVEINIAPLQDNTFTNCKSELKFFEAAICGTLTLATPTFSFRNSIAHGKTGFLVPSHAWDPALEEAVAIVEDKSRYEAVATAASEYVQAAYGWDCHAHTIARAVFGLERHEAARTPAVASELS